MKKLALLIALLLASTLVVAYVTTDYQSPFAFPWPRTQGVERVTHYDPRVTSSQIDRTTYLNAVEAIQYPGYGRGGTTPFAARGVAKVRSAAWRGFPRSSVVITTKDIPASDKINGAYEAWLVDDDSGYMLSLGTFTTVWGGSGELRYKGNTYLDEYDRIEITLEPFNDYDVRPGPVVLEGPMPNSRAPYYNPKPKQTKMLTSSFSTI